MKKSADLSTADATIELLLPPLGASAGILLVKDEINVPIALGAYYH